jgi:hypothetical protein
MVSGERFGISQEDLTAISDKMSNALDRVEKMSRAEDTDESFDEIMNVIENQISLLYEEYDKLIGKTSIGLQGRKVDIVDIDSKVRFC